MSNPREIPGFYFDPDKNRYFPLVNGKPPPHIRKSLKRARSPPPPKNRPPSPPPSRSLPPSGALERFLYSSGQLPRYRQTRFVRSEIFKSTESRKIELSLEDDYWGVYGGPGSNTVVNCFDAWASRDCVRIAHGNPRNMDILVKFYQIDKDAECACKEGEESSAVMRLVTHLVFSDEGDLCFAAAGAQDVSADWTTPNDTQETSICFVTFHQPKIGSNQRSSRFTRARAHRSALRTGEDSNDIKQLIAHPKYPIFILLGRYLHYIVGPRGVGEYQHEFPKAIDRIYDASNFGLHKMKPGCISFSEDGTKFAVGTYTGTIAVFELTFNDGKVFYSLVGQPFRPRTVSDPVLGIGSFRVTPDGVTKVLFDTPRSITLLRQRKDGKISISKCQEANEQVDKQGLSMLRPIFERSPKGTGIVAYLPKARGVGDVQHNAHFFTEDGEPIPVSKSLAEQKLQFITWAKGVGTFPIMVAYVPQSRARNASTAGRDFIFGFVAEKPSSCEECRSRSEH